MTASGRGCQLVWGVVYDRHVLCRYFIDQCTCTAGVGVQLSGQSLVHSVAVAPAAGAALPKAED